MSLDLFYDETIAENVFQNALKFIEDAKKLLTVLQSKND